jgi:hypothetical protein
LRGEEGADFEAPVALVAPLSPFQSTLSHFETRCADFIVVPNGFRFGNTNIVIEDPFHVSSEVCERAETPDSLAKNFHSSDEPSMSSSGYLTRRSDSPGPVFNGVGGWTVGYFFSSPPLPLVPQWHIPLQPQYQFTRYDNDDHDVYEESTDSDDLDDDVEHGSSTR